MRTFKALLLILALSTAAMAQSASIEAYLSGSRVDIEEILKRPKGSRHTVVDGRSIQNLLPHNLSGQYVQYAKSKMNGAAYRALLDNVDSSRLNKFLGAAVGGSGSTSLASLVSAPAVLGFAIEHGTILQQQDGTTVSLRANALGLAELAWGSKDLGYCAQIDTQNCSDASRNLRRFSGSVSLEDSRDKTVAATAGAATPVHLLDGDFRMASWGVRYDITFRQNLDDPSYLKAWKTEIEKLEGSQSARDLTAAIDTFIAGANNGTAYRAWRDQTLTLLNQADDEAELKKILEAQLDLLQPTLSAADPDFGKNFAALDRAYKNYFAIRDELVRNAQRHKLAAEYVNLHPKDQPNRSTVRLVYSHLPFKTDTLLTANFAMSFYHSKPATTGSFRDLQMAAQLDQKVGRLRESGQIILTLGGYYQWMGDDALLTLDEGNAAPGSGIVPGTAASLLGTKGHIGIVQGKVTLPLTDNIKIPVSLTWANRTELINEKDVKGQVGLTLDLDKLFR